MMSKGLTGLGVIACLSGPLGGLLSGWIGWRFALLALAMFGAATLALVVWRFEETIPQKNPQALQAANLLQTWGGIVRHPTFWAWSALSAASYGGLFTVLASSSFVFIDVLGVSRPAYGFIMSSVSLTYILGTLACRRLLPRFGVRRTVALAATFTLAGGTLMGLFALAGLHNGWTIMGPFYLFMLAHGVHQPCSQSGAVGPFPYAAGAASALNGLLMALGSFIVGRKRAGRDHGRHGARKYVGWTELEQGIRDEFANAQKLDIPIHALTVWTKDNLAWYAMELDYIRYVTDGAELKRTVLPMRETGVLERRDGGWQLLSWHESFRSAQLGDPLARPPAAAPYRPVGEVDTSSLPNIISGEWEILEVEDDKRYKATLDKYGNGPYTQHGGRFTTITIANRLWQGIWEQPGNDREGGFEVLLSEDGTQAHGIWWYSRIGTHTNIPPREHGGTYH